MRPTVRVFAAPGAKARLAAAADKASRAASRTGGADDSNMSPLLARLTLLVRPVHPPAPVSQAERDRRRRLMIDYGHLKRAQTREGDRKAAIFLAAKWAAMDALPTDARRKEALAAREVPPPLNRPLWTHTPPIPDFNVGDLTKKNGRA
jgi:hypothetical protein